MFTLTITITEGEDISTVSVHGVGTKATEGEQHVASDIASYINKHVGPKVKIDDDVLAVTSPSEDDFQSLEDLLSVLARE